ncbi:MAG: TonB-dependent receptor [Bryobacteraceae bacterium]|nr:TonB-dependent receptor [Bryobacteraceae bacterium]
MTRALLLGLFSVVLAFGQATSATLVGTVKDSTGAVIPGATITITNVETQVRSVWTTNSTGDFTAPFLLPGSYEIAAEKEGFKRVVRSGVTLQVGDRSRLDFDLTVGAVSETVNAVGEAPLVKSDSSEVGQVIQDRPIVELPLTTGTGRNFTSLMTLVPGTIRTSPVGVFDAPQGNSSFAVNGQRDGANNYMIDGADNNEVLLGIVTVLPPPEAISEFKLQTNSFAAEFGRAGGAVINVQTRSGTNQFRGSLYEFFRHDRLDARGPFDPEKLPRLRQNEFGGTLGGPVIRNKTFFFANAVWFKQRAGQSIVATVPTQAQREGRFLASEGAGTIYDPRTRQPFANNTIDAASQNPIARRLLSLYPLPNQPGTVRAGTGVANNYRGVVVQQQDASRLDTRIDHTFNSKNTLFGRYSLFDAYTALPPLFGDTATGSLPSRAGKGDSRNHSAVIGDVHVFSGTKINEFRLAFSRISNTFVGYDYGRNLAQELGIPNLNIYGDVSSGLPRINIENVSSLGVDAPIPALRYEQTWQLVDNFTWIKGKHNVKFGIDFRDLRGDFFQISLESPRGRFDFDRSYTSNNGAAGTGLGVASALLGFPSLQRRGVIYHFPANRMKHYFFFAQDDFKVSSKLTLNLGIRYELYMPVVDNFDNQSNFDMQTGRVLLAGRGRNSRELINKDLNNWAPRFGFAYAWKPRTVVRGGYGLSYYPDKFGATGGTLNTNYPFITLQEIIPDRFTINPALSITNGIVVPSRPDLTAESVPLVGNITAFDPNYRMGYIQFWNLTVQQQIGKDMVLDTAYVGTKGTHLFGNNHVNLNQPDPGPGAIDPRRPYFRLAPQAGSIPLRDSSQSSIYHSLQVKFEKRMSAGFWFLNSYTWAKSIDDAAAKFNPRDWRGTARGPSNTDFRHSWTTSALYEIPFGRGRRFGSQVNGFVDSVLGGWQLNGIYTFRTGLPVTASLAAGLVSSTVNTGGASRPDQTGNPELDKDERSLARYFNTGAFVSPAANSFRFGNAGRNTIRGPSLSGLDFSVFKVFRFAERFQLQTRGEFFNLPNHPNWGQPNAQVGSPAIGTINALATGTTMRQVQLGLKLLF